MLVLETYWRCVQAIDSVYVVRVCVLCCQSPGDNFTKMNIYRAANML